MGVGCGSALPALHGIGSLTGAPEWARLAAGAVTLTQTLTQNGRVLPPDWARLTASGAVQPEPAPNGSQPQTRYGLDAQRTVAWFAASCDPGARALAARWWPLLRRGDRAQALALQPGGTVLNGSPAVLPLVASAAAAKVAGTARRLANCSGAPVPAFPAERCRPFRLRGRWGCLYGGPVAKRR